MRKITVSHNGKTVDVYIASDALKYLQPAIIDKAKEDELLKRIAAYLFKRNLESSEKQEDTAYLRAVYYTKQNIGDITFLVGKSDVADVLANPVRATLKSEFTTEYTISDAIEVTDEDLKPAIEEVFKNQNKASERNPISTKKHVEDNLKDANLDKKIRQTIEDITSGEVVTQLIANIHQTVDKHLKPIEDEVKVYVKDANDNLDISNSAFDFNKRLEAAFSLKVKKYTKDAIKTAQKRQKTLPDEIADKRDVPEDVFKKLERLGELQGIIEREKYHFTESSKIISEDLSAALDKAKDYAEKLNELDESAKSAIEKINESDHKKRIKELRTALTQLQQPKPTPDSYHALPQNIEAIAQTMIAKQSLDKNDDYYIVTLDQARNDLGYAILDIEEAMHDAARVNPLTANSENLNATKKTIADKLAGTAEPLKALESVEEFIINTRANNQSIQEILDVVSTIANARSFTNRPFVKPQGLQTLQELSDHTDAFYQKVEQDISTLPETDEFKRNAEEIAEKLAQNEQELSDHIDAFYQKVEQDISTLPETDVFKRNAEEIAEKLAQNESEELQTPRKFISEEAINYAKKNLEELQTLRKFISKEGANYAKKNLIEKLNRDKENQSAHVSCHALVNGIINLEYWQQKGNLTDTRLGVTNGINNFLIPRDISNLIGIIKSHGNDWIDDPLAAQSLFIDLRTYAITHTSSNAAVQQFLSGIVNTLDDGEAIPESIRNLEPNSLASYPVSIANLDPIRRKPSLRERFNAFWERHPVAKQVAIGALIGLGIVAITALAVGIIVATGGAGAVAIAGAGVAAAAYVGGAATLGGIIAGAAAGITLIGAAIGGIVGRIKEARRNRQAHTQRYEPIEEPQEEKAQPSERIFEPFFNHPKPRSNPLPHAESQPLLMPKKENTSIGIDEDTMQPTSSSPDNTRLPAIEPETSTSDTGFFSRLSQSRQQLSATASSVTKTINSYASSLYYRSTASENAGHHPSLTADDFKHDLLREAARLSFKVEEKNAADHPGIKIYEEQWSGKNFKLYARNIDQNKDAKQAIKNVLSSEKYQGFDIELLQESGIYKAVRLQQNALGKEDDTKDQHRLDK